MIKNLYFGGSGFNTIIFEKYFISYSCILFIKYYALRSFCIKLLYFSKTLIFPDFRSIELLLDWSKLRLKNWFESARFDHCWINWRHFRSIESNFRSIENHIESFLKLWVFTCSITYKLFQKHFSLFLRSRLPINFLSFSLKLFARFLSSKAGKTLLPLLFHLFSLFMHFFMHLREIFEPKEIWGFWRFQSFIWKLINGFLLWDVIYNWSLSINLINLLIWENLNFLGLISTRIGDLFN